MSSSNRRILTSPIVWCSMVVTTIGSGMLPSRSSMIVFYAGIHIPVFLAAMWLWRRRGSEEWGEIARTMTVLAVLWTGATPRERFEANMQQLTVIAASDALLAFRRRNYLEAQKRSNGGALVEQSA